MNTAGSTSAVYHFVNANTGAEEQQRNWRPYPAPPAPPTPEEIKASVADAVSTPNEAAGTSEANKAAASGVEVPVTDK